MGARARIDVPVGFERLSCVVAEDCGRANGFARCLGGGLALLAGQVSANLCGTRLEQVGFPSELGVHRCYDGHDVVPYSHA